MAETALEDLYEIMRTGKHLRDRLNAAVSASRIERTVMPGETMPPCLAYLRYVIDRVHEGVRFSDQLRREAATALAIYEKRVSDAVIKADGRGELIAGSDVDGAPGLYRAGGHYHGLATHMDRHRQQRKR